MLSYLVKTAIIIHLVISGFFEKPVLMQINHVERKTPAVCAVFSLEETGPQVYTQQNENGNGFTITFSSSPSVVQKKSVAEGAHFIEYTSSLLTMSFIIQITGNNITDAFSPSFSSYHYTYTSGNLHLLSSMKAKYTAYYERFFQQFSSSLTAEITSAGSLSVVFL